MGPGGSSPGGRRGPSGSVRGSPPSCACPGGDEFSVCAKVFDLNGNLVWHKHQNGITLEDGGSQRGHKEGNIIWEGQRLDNGTPTAGVYTYRILVDHVSTLGLESEGMCEQEVTVGTPTIDREKNEWLIDSVKEFAYWNFDPQAGTMSVATKYKRNAPASACTVRYFGPNATGEIVQLGEVALTGDLDSGEYWSPATTLNVQVDENGNLEGTYYAAVSALETATGGLVNRDLQPKYGLQKGSHTLTPVPWGAQLKSVGFCGTAARQTGANPSAAPPAAYHGLAFVEPDGRNSDQAARLPAPCGIGQSPILRCTSVDDGPGFRVSTELRAIVCRLQKRRNPAHGVVAAPAAAAPPTATATCICSPRRQAGAPRTDDEERCPRWADNPLEVCDAKQERPPMSLDWGCNGHCGPGNRGTDCGRPGRRADARLRHL
jgi:hypothetical protein